MKTFSNVGAIAAVLCIALGAVRVSSTPPSALLAQNANNAKSAAPALASVPLTSDHGKFGILLDGNAIGTEEFEISRSGDNWMARGSSNARVPGGQEIKASGQLKLSADGIPVRYDWSAQLQKKATGFVDFVNGTGKCSIDLGSGAPILKEFTFTSPRVAVLDNNLYYQYALLAQMYDWKAGGKQDFPVLIPQDMVPGSISVEAAGPQPVDNGTYQALRIKSTDLELLLYTDGNHHMVRLDVPTSKVTIKRE